MSNLEIYREVKKIYDPKTAFGNAEILDLLKKIVEPNKNGFFEVQGDVEQIVKIEWRCADCGSWNETEEDGSRWNWPDNIKEKCRCGAKNQISF